jgi:diguanylate cyclase (GGDEF)-like protein
MKNAMHSDHSAFETELATVPETVPVALALLDIDEFKELNDEQGREAGDLVLRSLERILATNLPSSAIVGRVGGDEYAVALQRTSPESALILFEEMRAHLALHDSVSVSVGIAGRPQHASGANDLMRAADEALFRAKREGRGRVAIYVEDRMTLKSNYYPKAALERLSKLSDATGRTEASLLREALDDLLASRSDEL